MTDQEILEYAREVLERRRQRHGVDSSAYREQLAKVQTLEKKLQASKKADKKEPTKKSLSGSSKKDLLNRIKAAKEDDDEERSVILPTPGPGSY